MVRSAAMDISQSAPAEAQESPFVRAGFDPQELLKQTPVKLDGDKVLVQNAAPTEQALQELQTPAQKLMTDTMEAAKKELTERKTKNGSVSEADFKEILPKYFPQMKEAISLADKQAAAARKTAETEYVKVKPDLERLSAAMPKAMERVGAALNTVPKDDQPKVGALLGELTDDKTAAARKAEIRKDLAKYPDLADSAEAFTKVSKEVEQKVAPLAKAITEMQVGLAQGLSFRGFYAESLKTADADPNEIQRVTKEAQAVAQLYVRAMQAPGLLFMPPEDLQPKKPLPPVYKA